MKFRIWITKNIKLNKSFVVPIVSAAIFSLTVFCCSNLSYGLTIECNGKKIATVPNEEIYQKANRLIETELISPVDDSKNIKKEKRKDIIKPKVKLEPMLIPNQVQSYCSCAGDVRNKIVKESNSDITEAVGIFIDDKLFSIGENSEQIKNTLNLILESEKEKYYNCGNPNLVAEFKQKVELLDGLYYKKDIIDINEIESSLKNGVLKVTQFKVNKNDTVKGIAKKFEITVEDLLKMNEKIEPNIYVNEILNIKTVEKILDIKITETETTEEKIPFIISKIEDSTINEGETIVTQQGQEGIRKITQNIVFVNGTQISKEKIFSEVLVEPTSENLKIGTKKQINKNMTWPVPSSNRVTSPFGALDGRSASHKGTDISGQKGAAIVASKKGIVEIAGYSENGYGLQVKINHGEGLSTRYAHCNSLNVKEGQQVNQGQEIAYIGLTGHTTGPHLHFEVMINGKPQNPNKYFQKSTL